jgi:hypothetical protein
MLIGVRPLVRRTYLFERIFQAPFVSSTSTRTSASAELQKVTGTC